MIWSSTVLVALFRAAVFLVAAVLWADMMRRVGENEPTWRHELGFVATTSVLSVTAPSDYLHGVMLVAVVLTAGSALGDGQWWRRIVRWRAFVPAVALLLAR